MLIVETLKAFRTTLLGANIDIFTNHKNLTYKLSQYQTQRVIRWRLTLVEFKTNFHYKLGATNAVADALSRVPSKCSERETQEAPVEVSNKNIYCMFGSNPDMAECLSYDPEIAECFL